MKKRNLFALHFNFQGYVSRRQFWLNFTLPVLFIQFVVGAFLQYDGFDFTDGLWQTAELIAAIVSLPVQLMVLWISIVVCSKRLASAGFPRRTLIALIPVIGMLWLLAELLFAQDKPIKVGSEDTGQSNNSFLFPS
ncbi:DUF805 domain-containing protein [Vibrio sp. 16]|uniref:DUF805 domain-containing protein n=1 Tax=Vibrio sp. 16 TaxID=391586 RepID=UPI00018F1B7F|nr:DUF805 domain-containing protein [Vibrio sp. 16]EED25380.1 conserved hypothetical protein [Vibrio sp. 16]CAK4076516.1 hypothetical protein PVDT1_12 [Vibrio sp. 16]